MNSFCDKEKKIRTQVYCNKILRNWISSRPNQNRVKREKQVPQRTMGVN